MKIAILAPSHKSFIGKFLPNYPDEVLPEGYNGAPFLGVLIEEFLKKGHEVIAITTTQSDNFDFKSKVFSQGKFKWIVIPRRKLTIRNNGKRLGLIVDFFKQERMAMRNVVLEENPDFAHAHWSYEFAGAVKGLDIPHLITIHDNAYQVFRYMTNVYRFGRLLMSEWILTGIRFNSTVSPYMKSYATSRSKVSRIIPNPVNVLASLNEIDEQIDNKLKHDKGNFCLIMIINGWSKLKNGNNGLQAFKIIQAKYPNATLYLYGSGTEAGGLAYQYALKNNIRNIEFCGTVSHDKLMQEIKVSYLMIHPSYEESFGLVLIEAMAQGVPVIGGSNSGAVPWVINNKDLLVDVSKPEEIAKCTIEILKNNIRYKSIALSCHKNTVERFSAKSITLQYLNYYQDIIKDWR